MARSYSLRSRVSRACFSALFTRLSTTRGMPYLVTRSWKCSLVALYLPQGMLSPGLDGLQCSEAAAHIVYMITLARLPAQ